MPQVVKLPLAETDSKLRFGGRRGRGLGCVLPFFQNR